MNILLINHYAGSLRHGMEYRPYYLAELPQLINVLPGITDWAAILYRDESAILGRAADPERAYRETILPAKLDYYVRYVRERSFWTDLRIVFSTLVAIVH